MRKICFITYHNWETKRHGGFHQFAKASAGAGYDTIFLSFSRPYYIKFKHEERLNNNVLRELCVGKDYKIGNGILHNVTWPTLALPGPFRKFFPYKVNEWLMTHSFSSFGRFKDKWLKNTDCFVFESCEAVVLAKKIKEEFPESKIIYRPSDPLWEFSNDFFNELGEEEMIRIADRILTVNEESIDGYRYKFPNAFITSKFKCIPNGVDVQNYRKRYEVPELLNYPRTACYIGSFLPDWDLLEKSVKALPDVRFVIITPHQLKPSIQEMVDAHDNLIYIDGISPTEVPKWVTNCRVVIQPFPREYTHLNKVSLGLTAQNYKAMAANKPIVTYNIPLKLSRYGLITTDKVEDFIKGVENAFKRDGNVEYPNFDIESRDWKLLCANFLKECFI